MSIPHSHTVDTLWALLHSRPVFIDTKVDKTDRSFHSVSQGLAPSNSSDLNEEVELRANMVELLRRSMLYIEPVDPVYWCGALRKCEGGILPCLRVRLHF